jgi:hypothetical protein
MRQEGRTHHDGLFERPRRVGGLQGRAECVSSCRPRRLAPFLIVSFSHPPLQTLTYYADTPCASTVSSCQPRRLAPFLIVSFSHPPLQTLTYYAAQLNMRTRIRGVRTY